jgi:hypothetical protein
MVKTEKSELQFKATRSIRDVAMLLILRRCGEAAIINGG